ncbi:MAG: BlaI/MecI/CopY family transcriptional regulator [Eubacterium sp.]|nr:BlaI/MecI/CopY family transcriptional regulator [Eubacterium sp.]
MRKAKKTIYLTEAEMSLMELIWEKGSLPVKELIQMADRKLDWRRTTMYTVLGKLIDKGLAQNECAVVSCLISREEYDNLQRKNAIKEYFSGSLPGFLNAFVREEKLSAAELDELEEIIKSYKNAHND